MFNKIKQSHALDDGADFCVKTYHETNSFKIVQARYRRKFNFNTFTESDFQVGQEL